MVVGAGMTFVVQSSSVFTSAITPLIGECPWQGRVGQGGLAGKGLKEGAEENLSSLSGLRLGCDQHRAGLPPHTGLQHWHDHHSHPGCTGQPQGEAVQRLPGTPRRVPARGKTGLGLGCGT